MINTKTFARREQVITYSDLGKILLAGAALSLAACGGGGGGGLNSTPTPTPAPPPTSSSSAVDIFPLPATQEFTTIGSGNSLRIRYDAVTKKYEVMAEGRGWETLVDDPLFSPHPGNPNVSFVFAGSPSNSSSFMIRTHYSYADPTVKYQYSSLAPWSVGSVGGVTAFGMATAASGVPVVGSASYQGLIEGGTTETYSDGFETAPGYVVGSINLNFNFGNGSLSGSISPTLHLASTHSLATLNFTDTVYSTGSPNFSGSFSTSLAGPNSFAGLFTGPAAQELIGRFAFPYLSPVDGTAEQAAGAFVAKRP